MKLVAAALVAVAASWMLAGSAAGQAAEVRVVVNGVDVPLAVPAVVFNGQVMAPMSGLFEPMGAIAAYYETDRSIVVTNRVRTTRVLWLNETAVLVNGQPQSLPVAPALLGSEVFVPVQATFALLGAWARFDGPSAPCLSTPRSRGSPRRSPPAPCRSPWTPPAPCRSRRTCSAIPTGWS